MSVCCGCRSGARAAATSASTTAKRAARARARASATDPMVVSQPDRVTSMRRDVETGAEACSVGLMPPSCSRIRRHSTGSRMQPQPMADGERSPSRSRKPEATTTRWRPPSSPTRAGARKDDAQARARRRSWQSAGDGCRGGAVVERGEPERDRCATRQSRSEMRKNPTGTRASAIPHPCRRRHTRCRGGATSCLAGGGRRSPDKRRSTPRASADR